MCAGRRRGESWWIGEGHVLSCFDDVRIFSNHVAHGELVASIGNHVDHGTGVSSADRAPSSVCTRSMQVCIVWCDKAKKLELLEAESYGLIFRM